MILLLQVLCLMYTRREKSFFFLEQTNQVNDVTEFTCSNVALMSLQFDEFVRFEVDVSCAAQH